LKIRQDGPVDVIIVCSDQTISLDPDHAWPWMIQSLYTILECLFASKWHVQNKQQWRWTMSVSVPTVKTIMICTNTPLGLARLSCPQCRSSLSIRLWRLLVFAG